MSKVWHINVKREIEEPFNFHIVQDDRPTTEQIFRELSEVHYIDDDPKYCRVEVTEVDTNE
jgi:hypothetical protein